MGGGGGRKSKPKKLKNKRKRAGCVTDAGAACQSSHLHFTHRLAQYRKQTVHKQRKYQGRQQELKKAAESRRTNADFKSGFQRQVCCCNFDYNIYRNAKNKTKTARLQNCCALCINESHWVTQRRPFPRERTHTHNPFHRHSTPLSNFGSQFLESICNKILYFKTKKPSPRIFSLKNKLYAIKKKKIHSY